MLKQRYSVSKPNMFEVICLWLIGVTVTLDIVAITLIGNTPLLLSPILSIIYLLYELLKGRGKLNVYSSKSNIILGIFFLYVSLSMLFPFFYGFGDNAEVSTYGVMVLISQLAVYFSVSVNPSELKYRAVMAGFIAGISLNAIYSIYQYLGIIFGLPWVELKGLVPQYEVTLYQRVSGFFVEPSYLVALLIPGLIIILCFGRRFRLLNAGFVSAALLLSFSSGLWLAIISIIILIAAMISILLFSGNAMPRINRKQMLRTISVIIIIIVVIVTIAYSLEDRPKLEKAFTKYFDQPRTERLRTMSYSISLAVSDYPIGCGYNMGPTAMQEEYGTTAIHSLFGSLLLEVGIPGLILFLIFLFSLAIPLLRKREDYRSIGLGLALIFSFTYSFLTYNSIFYFQWLISGLALCYRYINANDNDSPLEDVYEPANV